MPRFDCPAVLVCLTRWLVIVTLTLSLGAHWILLQSVAWAGMFVSYSRQASLTEAIIKTFDGNHPCCLCKIVRQGKASENRKESQKPENKLESFLPTGHRLPVCLPQCFLMISGIFNQPVSHIDTPPKPPPRLA